MRAALLSWVLVAGCSSRIEPEAVPDVPDASVETDSEATDTPYAPPCNTANLCCCGGGQNVPAECSGYMATCSGTNVLYAGDFCSKCPGPCCQSTPVLDTGTPSADGAPDIAVDGNPTDANTDARDAAPDAAADLCASACCCQGDWLSTVMCTSAGPTCASGFGLYYGDACRCLPDRNTPCCLPHPIDAGG